MSDFIVFYTESNIICLIIFGIILIHDLFNIDRQEKQIKYDHALMAFMCYFVSDTIWAMTIDGVIPRNLFTVALANFLNCVFMAAITYTWLLYVMALEQTKERNKPIRKLLTGAPFILSTLALLALNIFAPSLLIDENLEPTLLYTIFLIAVPIIYIIFELFYSIRRAYWEPNPIEKKRHIYVGALPLLVIAGGLFQVIVLPNSPIFCFSCAILMLIFNIISMEASTSMDPLTGLSNRSQLMRVVSQKNNLQSDDKRTFVVMIDINGFKSINDTYGHAEGDNALVVIAESLKKVSGEDSSVIFVGRYGGDEFIMLVQSESDETVNGLIDKTRKQIIAECEARNTPYIIYIGAGFDEIKDETDSFKACMQRADNNMYANKTYCKKNGFNTIIHRDSK